MMGKADEETLDSVHVVYEVELAVTEDAPAPTEDDIGNAILRYCTDLGISIIEITVNRA